MYVSGSACYHMPLASSKLLCRAYANPSGQYSLSCLPNLPAPRLLLSLTITLMFDVATHAFLGMLSLCRAGDCQPHEQFYPVLSPGQSPNLLTKYGILIVDEGRRCLI